MDRRFISLLDEFGQAAGQVKSAKELKGIEKTLWNEYGIEQAVFILDMSGFSRLSQKYGLVHYLSMISLMRKTVSPIVRRYGGSVVKFEADNSFARFPFVHDAIRAGIAIKHGLTGMNIMTSKKADSKVSIGIDYGPFLLVVRKDYFGDPVNLASKLGEDIAGMSRALLKS